MKFSLRLKSEEPMTHAEAVGCMAANLALPGAGSLAAGRAVGYAQLVIATIGLIVSGVSCALALKWYYEAAASFSDIVPDSSFLIELWQHLEWPLAGMGIFLVGFGWAVITGRQILAEHPKENAPPRIDEV